ncbi:MULTISPECIES: helix-turn-helix transcriptional regulator [unclassified Mucilaginibacter]|uniref:response regulator transcription factor n=1 Tax=unclassified Mucilaginibacter TaxID=2617802 RepID=UPI0031F6E943
MNLPQSFPTFLKAIQQFEIGELSELVEGSKHLKSIMSGHLGYYAKLMPAIYILDYTQQKYTYASSNLNIFIDHPLSRFFDGGLDFAWSVFQKDDLNIYSQRVLPENLAFLKTKPISQHSDFLFTSNYRIRNRKGDYKQIRQQSTFIKSAQNGMPLATIGFLYDISAYTNSTKVVHTIEPIIYNRRDRGELLLNKVYFPYEQDGLLTVREIEVLKWICEGITSKQIADRLFISVNTINIHRRNILEKTNSNGLVDLIKYAISNGYL